MSQERERMVERAVLTVVGLLALAAILVFLPDANAQSMYQPIKPARPYVISASMTSKARS